MTDPADNDAQAQLDAAYRDAHASAFNLLRAFPLHVVPGRSREAQLEQLNAFHATVAREWNWLTKDHDQSHAFGALVTELSRVSSYHLDVLADRDQRSRDDLLDEALHNQILLEQSGPDETPEPGGG